MIVYKVYYEYEDEHSGYIDDLGYYMSRNDAECFLIELALNKFPDNIEVETVYNSPSKIAYVRDTRHQGRTYYHIELIAVIEELRCKN